jgi:hypothetical protein
MALTPTPIDERLYPRLVQNIEQVTTGLSSGGNNGQEQRRTAIMRILSLCLLSFLFVLTLGPPNHDAKAGYCPSMKDGKCPTQKKVTHKRSDFTAEQKAKMMDDARKLCKKRYGAASTVYKLDYYKWNVICNEH